MSDEEHIKFKYDKNLKATLDEYDHMYAIEEENKLKNEEFVFRPEKINTFSDILILLDKYLNNIRLVPAKSLADLIKYQNEMEAYLGEKIDSP